MKTNTIFAILFLILCNGYSQGLMIKTPNSSRFYMVDKDGIVKGEFTGQITKLIIKLSESPQKTYYVTLGNDNDTIGTFISDGNEYEVEFPKDILKSSVDYIDNDKNAKSFILLNGNVKRPKVINKALEFTSIDKFKELFPKINVTNHGIKILDEGNSNTQYKGKNYVHLFFDLNGNPIMSSIPQGLSNMQYVVHIFYLTDVDNPNRIDYTVNQVKGEFNGSIVFNNTEKLTTFDLRNSGDIKQNGTNYNWIHKEILLSTSTSDIKFEINRIIMKNPNSLLEIEKSTLNTYGISMSPVYHGTFEIGIVNSNLSNPTYELVESSDNPDAKVVNESNNSNRGYITAMATFYLSPVVVVRKIFGSDIPSYKLTGRNFLDDHKIYERFYPSVGVGIGDKIFENLFFGLSWEFARGGSFWAGGHYGKVNIFNKPANFEFEKTVTSDSEFKLWKDSDWDMEFAVGINLDIKLVKNLFKK